MLREYAAKTIFGLSDMRLSLAANHCNGSTCEETVG
jgi:hypothetical protein